MIWVARFNPGGGMSKKNAISSNRVQRMRNVVGNRLDGLTMVAEGTHLRHNLSAIIRSAESFGVSKVHLISLGKQKASGAAKGSERWVELQVHNTAEECLSELKSQGFKVFVADFQEDSYTPETLPIDNKVAIVMGTELAGVSESTKALADGSVMIPMFGFTQSLNVSVASACLLQRISTRMRDQGVGLMGDSEQVRMFDFWIEREKMERLHRRNRGSLKVEKPVEPIVDEDPHL